MNTDNEQYLDNCSNAIESIYNLTEHFTGWVNFVHDFILTYVEFDKAFKEGATEVTFETSLEEYCHRHEIRILLEQMDLDIRSFVEQLNRKRDTSTKSYKDINDVENWVIFELDEFISCIRFSENEFYPICCDEGDTQLCEDFFNGIRTDDTSHVSLLFSFRDFYRAFEIEKNTKRAKQMLFKLLEKIDFYEYYSCSLLEDADQFDIFQYILYRRLREYFKNCYEDTEFILQCGKLICSDPNNCVTPTDWFRLFKKDLYWLQTTGNSYSDLGEDRLFYRWEDWEHLYSFSDTLYESFFKQELFLPNHENISITYDNWWYENIIYSSKKELQCMLYWFHRLNLIICFMDSTGEKLKKYKSFIEKEKFIFDESFVECFIGKKENKKSVVTLLDTFFNSSIKNEKEMFENLDDLKIKLFTGVNNPDMVEINTFGYDDFYMMMSKENTNDLLFWYMSNYKHFESNLKEIGFTWCYLLEEVPDKHPFIYLFFGKDITKITVNEFTKETRATAPENMTYSYCDESLATIDLEKYFDTIERNCSDIIYVHDEMPLENYSIERRHIRHLSNEDVKGRPTEDLMEKTIQRKRRRVKQLVDFIISIPEEKQNALQTFIENLKNIGNNDKSKAKYIKSQIGLTISDWPTYNSLKEYLDGNASNWSTITKEFK